MAAAANNVWRQQSPLAFDRQNPNRPSTQRGLTQLPPSRRLSALHKNAQFALGCPGQRGCTAGWAIRLPSPGSDAPGSRLSSPRCPGQGWPSPVNPAHQRRSHAAGARPARTDGCGAEFAIQETVETTKALPRLIQLRSLHPIKRVILSSCSAQELRGRAQLPGQRLAALNHLARPARPQPLTPNGTKVAPSTLGNKSLRIQVPGTSASSQFYPAALPAIQCASSPRSPPKGGMLPFESANPAGGDLPSARRSFLTSPLAPPNISPAPRAVWRATEVAVTLCGVQGAAQLPRR